MVNKKYLYLIVLILFSSVAYSQSEYYYNTSEFTNKSTISQILIKSNDYTLGWYGTGILLGYLIVVFSVSRKLALTTKDAAAVSFFSASLIGMLMIPLKIVKLDSILIIIVLFIIGLISIFWD